MRLVQQVQPPTRIPRRGAVARTDNPELRGVSCLEVLEGEPRRHQLRDRLTKFINITLGEPKTSRRICSRLF